MSKYTTIILLAIWIMILPFLGFPGSWKTILFVVSGFSIVIYTFLLRNDSVNSSPFSFDKNGKNTDVYSENAPISKQEDNDASNILK